ncbi:MAG TPA: S53 family peptidase [Kofleriaceae bacterium]|nr:S53 family peptidase [Kofleriaceae bacterium]
MATCVAASAHAAPAVHPAWANVDADLGRVADEPLEHVTLWLARSAERERAFAAFRRDQDTPGSPHFHEWLTPAQIGARFGASDAELAQLTGWLAGRGFTVRRVATARMFVEVSGTTDVASSAFGVEFHRYAVAGESRLSIDREPSVPAELVPFVAGITGLVESTARPQHHFEAAPALGASGGGHYIGPYDFAAIYDLSPLWAAGYTGAGQTIGIIGRARVYAGDLAQYAESTNFAIATPTVILAGPDPGSACGATSCRSAAGMPDQFEATLDVERASATAPGAAIELIVSKSTTGEDGLEIALIFAIDHYGADVQANVLSISFAQCEASAGGWTNALARLFEQAAAQGQTIVASSGDAGAAMCDEQLARPPQSQTRDVNAYCSSGAVTCVGGTTLHDGDADWSANGSAVGYIPEGAWNEPGTPSNTVAAASGGGFSAVVALPSYQAPVAPPGALRMSPDVAFAASAHDGYYGFVTADGGGGFFYGTSAAAPAMAGVMAIVDQATGARQGGANAEIYRLAYAGVGAFHDVDAATSGAASCSALTPGTCNNSTPGTQSLTGGLAGFAIAPGYDVVTGWGSLDIAAFVASWPGGAFHLDVARPSLALAEADVSLARGEQTTIALSHSGFRGGVTYACSGLPDGATCTFADDSLTISIDATPGAAGIAIGLVAAAAIAFLRRRKLAALLGALALASCATAGEPTQIVLTSGTSAITVTATAATGETAAATLMLTIAD